MTEERTFDFGRAYQVKLLAMCCRQRAFLVGYRDLIKPQWFEDDVLVDIARLAVQYFDTYKAAPTVEALRESVADLLSGDKNRMEKVADFERNLADIASADVEESPDITDRVSRFARRQAVRSAMKESAADLNDGQYDRMEKRLSEALLVGTNRTNLGINYFTDEHRFTDDRTHHTITTGLPGLDKLLNGGSAPAELCIVEAPTGQFKTGSMVNIGTAALWQGCDVCHATFEVKEPQVARRYDGPILGRITSHAMPAHILRELEEKQKAIQSNLWIRYWPMGTATAGDIRGWIHALASEGKICTGKRRLLVIVDYGQIMRAERTYTEKRHEVRDIYQSLIRIADEFQCPVWTGMQTNRAAETKKLITKADLAECYAVAGDAHIILSLNQTKDERDDSMMRIFVAKSRESRSFQSVEVYVDMDYTRWKEPGMEWPGGKGDGKAPEPVEKPAPQAKVRRTVGRP